MKERDLNLLVATSELFGEAGEITDEGFENLVTLLICMQTRNEAKSVFTKKNGPPTIEDIVEKKEKIAQSLKKAMDFLGIKIVKTVQPATQHQEYDIAERAENDVKRALDNFMGNTRQNAGPENQGVIIQ